ncbi:MAG: hypothetical protein BJ554DRAFT_6403 [Olpidium bornovanus]|uniref:BAH domain-containing protein n=1 Tax=Olpidium bornovanus TaxID=278681 RepID=A0A8H7ZXM8_9FUNG|nr:MAG: hypothetical protein BJ554DRAFT_6403 [Olpidium bornovanus]
MKWVLLRRRQPDRPGRSRSPPPLPRNRLPARTPSARPPGIRRRRRALEAVRRSCPARRLSRPALLTGPTTRSRERATTQRPARQTSLTQRPAPQTRPTQRRAPRSSQTIFSGTAKFLSQGVLAGRRAPCSPGRSISFFWRCGKLVFNCLPSGDYVHVANPNNSDRPNVGHIWKILKNAIKLEPRIRVCWYYRPDQTVHQATRQFWENEVFKTMKIEDVPVASVLGRCFVLPIKDYMRGRPAALAAEKKDKGADCSSSSAGGGAGEVEPKVYVCESRYIENTKMTEKIRDWGSLAPEPRKFKRKARGRLPVFLRKHDDESATGNTSLNGIVLELFPTPITLNKVPSPFASEAALAAAAVAGAELEADDKGARAASPNPAPFFKGVSFMRPVRLPFSAPPLLANGLRLVCR